MLGPYLMLLPIARGGMGEVWIAAPMDSPDPSRLCLLKCIKSDLGGDAEAQSRFVDEANVALALRGQHLCHVFEAGAGSGQHFLAMELIEGVTFRQLGDTSAKESPLSTEEAVALAVGMLRGLHEAHAARSPTTGELLGVVHRDVSPQNAMVDVRGAVKVIDFGLATSTMKQTMTEAAVVLGKMAYMAPEQARGETAFAAADQFAGGVVLYELLTADRFYGDLPSRAIWGIVGSGQHRPRSWHLVPAGVAPVLARALAARPADRFPDCDAFATALLHAVPDAAGPSTAVRLGQRARAVSAGQQAQIAHARELLQRLRPDFDASVAESTQSMTLRVRDQGRVVRPAMATSTTSASSFVHAPAPGAAQVFTDAKAAPRARNRWLAAAVVAAGALAGTTVVAVQGLTTTSPSTPTTTAPSTTAPTTTAPTTTTTTTTAPTTTTTTTTATTTTATTTTAPSTNTNAENAAATKKPPSSTTTRNATTPDAASMSGNARRAREIEKKLLAADAGCSCRTAMLDALAKARGRGDDAVGIWLLTVERCLDKCGLH
jgi:serine/threonine-protein kinase